MSRARPTAAEVLEHLPSYVLCVGFKAVEAVSMEGIMYMNENMFELDLND